MIEEMIVSLLSASTDLKTYIEHPDGSIAIYPNQAPENAPQPYVIYTQHSAYERQETQACRAESAYVVLSYPPKGIDSENYLIGKRMAMAVREALRVQNYRLLGLCVHSVQLSDQKDDYSVEYDQHGVIQKFTFNEQL